MNCKNCGARLKENSKVCPNCGAFIDDGSGYVLLTDNYRSEDVYSEDITAPRKKRSGLRYFISLILVVIIAGAGAYYYFTNIYTPDNKPSLSFTSGSGIINEDEAVIYVCVKDGSWIEYIHGVELYDYDKTSSKLKKDPVSTNYQYTKSIDGSFRAIFFDVSEFEIDESSSYIYTFEMKFSPVDSDEVFTYQQTVDFTGNISENASDVVFDHSLDDVPVISTTLPQDIAEETTQSTTQSTTTTTTTTKVLTTTQNISYIYNSFWFTEPLSSDSANDISAIKFNNGGTYSETHYHYDIAKKKWTTTKLTGKFEIKDGELFTTDSEGLTESYSIDSSSKTLEGLTGRKYNSVKNAEDFFGL